MITTVSCKKKAEETNTTTYDYNDGEDTDYEPEQVTYTRYKDKDYIEEYTEDYSFPKTGSTAEDFIPKGTAFKIEYKDTGDINNDGLEDIAMVLSDPTERYISRPLIILLQNTDGTYRLDKVSKVVMPSEYTENGYSKRDDESINIENNGLSMNFNSMGFHGNIDYFFQYVNNELLLIYFEGYWHGAGGHTSINYSYKEKKIYRTDYNYDISTEKETTNTTDAIIPKSTFKFENINPNDYISLLISDYLDKEAE